MHNIVLKKKKIWLSQLNDRVRYSLKLYYEHN